MLIPSWPTLRKLAVLVSAVVLAGCATPDDTGHAAHHPEQASVAGQAGAGAGNEAATGASPGAGGMMGSGQAGSMMGGQMGVDHMDKNAMCEMYRRMQGAATDQERQAMMDQQMKGMTPQMRQQRMEMMRQQCK